MLTLFNKRNCNLDAYQNVTFKRVREMVSEIEYINTDYVVPGHKIVITTTPSTLEACTLQHLKSNVFLNTLKKKIGREWLTRFHHKYFPLNGSI